MCKMLKALILEDLYKKNLSRKKINHFRQNKTCFAKVMYYNIKKLKSEGYLWI